MFCAKGVDQALTALHHERIDIAPVDGTEPKKNGLTVCRTLRSNPETRLAPILLLTSWGPLKAARLNKKRDSFKEEN
jgi:CheY-like chemotaxis protein